MEVGSLRERILVALLIYRFDRENVETEVPITEHEVDVKVCGKGISIKTLTTASRRLGGVKAIWTVDADRSTDFVRDFSPRCDYLVAHVVWNNDEGGLYYLPLQAQAAVFETLDRDRYLSRPKEGTKPRGVEITAEAMQRLVAHPVARRIPIKWIRPAAAYDPYERWVEYWRLD